MRDSKGRFIKGHKMFPGVEKGWFTKERSWNKHPRFINGKWGYSQFKKSSCEDCGSTKYLMVHHIDHDNTNNKLKNLKTVCAKCHTNTYHPRKFGGNQYVQL
jgi:5-methylcytosine-specific restriction endonuclease McrA|tara:strand:+ start:2439 stop:2744 length:306 start_codon:yes stop_codon:yes gene_type:complete